MNQPLQKLRTHEFMPMSIRALEIHIMNLVNTYTQEEVLFVLQGLGIVALDKPITPETFQFMNQVETAKALDFIKNMEGLIK